MARMPASLSSSLLAGIDHFRDVPGWLRAPLQPGRLLEALGSEVPEFRRGPFRLQGVKAKRLFLKDAGGVWEGSYALELTGAEGRVEEVLLRGSVTAPWLTDKLNQERSTLPFGSPGWRFFLPDLNLSLEPEPFDEDLAPLPRLLDPEQARALLEEALHENGALPGQVSITSCLVNILSHKPGSRAAVQYHLEYSQPVGGLPALMIGKVYRKESKARNAYEGMLALWNAPHPVTGVVTIARPLALLPGEKAMFQAVVPGEVSQEEMLLASFDARGEEVRQALTGSITKAAAGLAAFHHSGAFYGKPAGVGERFADIKDLVTRLEAVFPEIRKHIQPLVDFLAGYEAQSPTDPPVPTHGTFNPEQVLVHGDGISFIDFDDYCLAEPALDVGLYRAAILDTGMNALDPGLEPGSPVRLERLASLDALCDSFLNVYHASAPVSTQRVHLWEALDALRNVLHTWVKVKASEPDHALVVLEQHLPRLSGL